MSAIDAAALVMARANRPLGLGELLVRMKRQGLWSTTAPTPKSTLAAALYRELALGHRSRIRKPAEGLYALTEDPVRPRGLRPIPRTAAPPDAPGPGPRAGFADSTTPASPPTGTAGPGR